jgi:hypothetical protein
MSIACGRYDAAFAIDDPDPVVDAALSCPACLSGESRVVVGMTGPELDARARCGECGSTWSLTLAPQQLLRLGLDPPRSSRVEWRGSLPPGAPSDGDV